MLKIGDAAKKFDISNRTLRYWEEKGILKSTRADNGYRFYDRENTLRIQQIVLLRRLEMPIAQIEDVFLSPHPDAAVIALSRHLEHLRRQAAGFNALAALVETMVRHIREENGLEQAVMHLEAEEKSILPAHERAALQMLLSQRSYVMSNQLSNVRIVKLPAMVVASYCAVSATPEEDCGKIFHTFVRTHSLHQRSDFRFFGFNNPSPTEGNPVYGYEMWVTVPPDFEVPQPLQKKKFDGGLYASISTSMNEIGERWQQLYGWCSTHEKYAPDFSVQWLEECCMDFESFTSAQVDDREKQLDLLEPIKLR